MSIPPRTLVVLAALLAACSSADPSQDTNPGGAATARPGSAPAKPAGEPAATGVEVTSGGLVFQAHRAWKLEPTTSPMRKLQATLPRQGADTSDGELVVYFFGAGQGGTKEANITRWAGQFEQPDGRPSSEVLARSSRRIGDLPVEIVDVSGTYVAETRPGSGTRVNEPGWRLLAAIVDAPDGPYFVKLTGPEATIGHWETAFHAFVGSVRVAP